MNPTAPLRVLYLARAPFVSGAERALMSMLRHLDRAKVEPMLAVRCATELIELARAAGVPVTVLAMAKREPRTLWAWWRSTRQLARLVRQFKPDLLHANDVPSCQAMSVVGAKLGVPRVIHVRWVIKAAEAAWWARAGAESLLCISQWMREQLGETAGTALAGAKVEVLPDAVDWPGEGISDKRQAISDKGQASQDGRLERMGGANGESAISNQQSAICLGFSGQLIESKGLDLVIEAMGRLPAERRPRLRVAGEDTQTKGAYLAQLKALAERSGVGERIEWLGFLKDVSALHRQVDAMVCPSRIEPLGLVPLEASRFCVPAIANRVGGLAETILHGETGWLVEPTVEGWTAALKQLTDRAALRRLGQAAHDRTREHYSPMVYQRRLMEIYQSIRK